MINIDTCRKSIKKDLSDTQIEDLRSRLYSLANLTINKFLELKSLFINSFQSITCKGRIVKPD